MTYIPPKPFEWNHCGTCGSKLEPAFDGERERPYCANCNRHYYRNPVPACCVFVRDEEGRLLFTQRAVEPCLGRWTLPGGFLELNESAEQCALRELTEETGLTGDGVQLLGVSVSQSADKGAVLVIGYCIATWRGTPRPDSDASDLRFFSKAERPQVPFEAHRELLALYDEMYP
ncbi:MAG TPA: NUDIX domain-containing protein [Candidatus Hydrogenedentes bacterium]|nr:NUDIX domain-containing protein [Candidatus Hydrogenedentota bacterium]